MLLGKPAFPGASTMNQLERIVQLLGKPTPSDIASIASPYAETIMESVTPKQAITFKQMFPTASAECLDLLIRLLTFDPTKRLTVFEAIEHPFVAKFHNNDTEPISATHLFLDLDDNKRLSSRVYRTLLYQYADCAGFPEHLLEQWKKDNEEREAIKAEALKNAVVEKPVPTVTEPAASPSPSPVPLPSEPSTDVTCLAPASASPSSSPSSSPRVVVNSVTVVAETLKPTPASPVPNSAPTVIPPSPKPQSSNVKESSVAVATEPSISILAPEPTQSAPPPSPPLLTAPALPSIPSPASSPANSPSSASASPSSFAAPISPSAAVSGTGGHHRTSSGTKKASSQKSQKQKDLEGMAHAWIIESPRRDSLLSASDGMEGLEDDRYKTVEVTQVPQADQVNLIRRNPSTTFSKNVEAMDSTLLKAQRCWPFEIHSDLSRDLYVPPLRKCVFIGRTKSDLDSVAATVGAAFLFDGRAARAGEINTETAFALEYWKVAPPDMVLEGEAVEFCLVGHQRFSEKHRFVPSESVIAIIDHHTLSHDTVTTTHPIFVDMRAWGSTSSIVAHHLLLSRKEVPPNVAGLLLSGILADTLNMRSPTTTDWDGKMVAFLAKVANVTDIDALAEQQFMAKCKTIRSLSLHALAAGNLRMYMLKGERWSGLVGVNVIEVVDPAHVISKQDKLVAELRNIKVEQTLALLFFVLVDSTKRTAEMLICGPREKSLAEQAFGGKSDGCWLHLRSKCSREDDIVPALQLHITIGWKGPNSADDKLPTAVQPLVVGSRTDGFVARKGSTDSRSVSESGRNSWRMRSFREKWLPRSPWRK
eukprot:c2203_g1_i2.p1 GENE.c2203_g1_i2~~c2203_g1_i2.p1  ORF type:complete len:819 (-),score=206.63 c2203_g1_i2:135-2591(-)